MSQLTNIKYLTFQYDPEEAFYTATHYSDYLIELSNLANKLNDLI